MASAHRIESRPFACLLRLCLALSLGLAAGCGGCEDEGASGGEQGCTGGQCADASDAADANDDTGQTTDTGAVDSGDDSGGQTDTGQPCPPDRQCAASCCAAGELCLGEQCVVPGDDCAHDQECSSSEICEPSLSKCIPDPGIVCEYVPGQQIFDPEVNLAWRDDPASTPMPQYNQVMMTPSVVDITDDGTPDIVFSTFTGGSYNQASVLRAVDGASFQPIFDLTDPSKYVSGSASVAIGDIDADGQNEIVAVAPQEVGFGLIAFDDHTTDWAVLWQTDGFSMAWDGAALVDLDADGLVEVVAANRVFSGRTGELLCVGDGISGSPKNSSAADVDGDGVQEIIAANGIFGFESDGAGGYTCPARTTFQGTGGFPAVGDFGTFTGGQRDFATLDGIPEIVTVNSGAGDQVELFDSQTGAKLWGAQLPADGHPYYSSAQCTTNGAGPPTVADFDGDGLPEVATAGACFYGVFDSDGSLLWKHASQDFSSRITGSSVFDFQGDGKAEVVYADECFIRVYDGAGNGDGTTEILFKRAHTSGTTRELPVIVDVDADFHAEIVLISNDYSGVDNTCRTYWPDFDQLGGEERGILVIEDAQNRWVSTRPVWNQHAYHVTNVCDGVDDSLCTGRANKPGAIPIGQQDNWKVDYLNNFRQNVQGEGLFNAPDLEIIHVATDCSSDVMAIEVTVANRGTRGVPAGVEVGVWVDIDAAGEQYLATLTTTVALPPGARETLTYDWPDAPDPSGQQVVVRAEVDTNDQGAQQHNECHEDNNAAQAQARCSCTEDAHCPIAEHCVEGDCVPRPG